MPAREQYRKEEIGEENQLQAACIQDTREYTWIQSSCCAASSKCLWWRFKEILKEPENLFEKYDLCERMVAEMQEPILMGSEAIIRKVLSGPVESVRETIFVLTRFS